MSLIKNTLYNLCGFAVPSIIAIPALGLLSRYLGMELFGVFTLAFAIVGYASIFDVGLTRTVIREISINRDNVSEQRKIISTSSISVLILGGVAGGGIFLYSPQIAEIIKVSDVFFDDVKESFQLLSLLVPVFLLNQIWLAYLEGLEKFGNINIQRIISSSCISALPAFAVLIEPTLKSATIGLVCGRAISLFLGFFACRKFILASKFIFYKETFSRLIKFGGWITISNIISPIMVYFDRFVISNLLGANKVAFYTAPSEGISRLLNIPFALARVLFPKLSSCYNKEDNEKLEKISYLVLIVTCGFIVFLGVFFSEEIMTIWMGSEFFGEPANIFSILLIGFFFNSLAQIPFAQIQARGHAKWTAALHGVELLPYLLLLYLLTVNFSLYGTAIAWTIRVTVDFLLLYILSRK
ncbi:flippase [Pectobacterium sp. IFB5596]|uniref:flippase n=1 Tax=Pectobacterium sp. IFB5596 TaxID=1839803 RepID=UPI001F1F30DB|nr:flippase [Pectobacterium sp. IFB5596]MCE9731563.1 transporter [Pectobacterium sp. IFB5596]